MRKLFLYGLSIALSSTILLSCECQCPEQINTTSAVKTEKEEKDLEDDFYLSSSLFQKFMGFDHKRIARGITVGDPVDSILINDPGELKFNTSKFKGFFQDISSGEYIQSYYTFDSDNDYLLEAEITANLIDDSTATLLKDDLEYYFEKKYGDSFNGLNGAAIWNCVSQDSLPFVLTMEHLKPELSDEVEDDFEYHKVVLTIQDSEW